MLCRIVYRQKTSRRSIIKEELNTFYIKDGLLYRFASNGRYERVLDGRVPKDVKKYGLFIDDSYFYYIYVGNISVKGNKLKAVVSNYVRTVIPLNLFGGIGICQNSKGIIALVYKDNFKELVESNVELFGKARFITTGFCEAFTKYSTFSYSDGARTYIKDDNSLSIASDNDLSALKLSDLPGSIVRPSSNVIFDNLKQSGTFKDRLMVPSIILGICYFFFLASLFAGYMGDKKVLKHYVNDLQEYYKSYGVEDSVDPYGALLSKNRQPRKGSFFIIDVFNKLNDSSLKLNVVADVITVTEKSVRIEAIANDFNAVETFKSNLGKKTGKEVFLESSTQMQEGVRFIVRYEP